MPTNRTPIRRRHHRRINAAALEAYRRGREILAAGEGDAWETDGGRRRELLEAERDIRRAIGMAPWAVSPLDDRLDEAMPAYMRHLASGGTWDEAKRLRDALEAALAAEDRR